jgi:hypothetical protein
MTVVATQGDPDRDAQVQVAPEVVVGKVGGLGWPDSHAVDIDVSRETTMPPSGVGWPT